MQYQVVYFTILPTLERQQFFIYKRVLSSFRRLVVMYKCSIEAYSSWRILLPTTCTTWCERSQYSFLTGGSILLHNTDKIYWRFGIGVFHVQHAIGAYFSWFAPLCPDCLHLSTATTITDDSRSSNLGNSQKVDSGLCCSQQPHVHMSWNNHLAFREREPTQACKLILNVLLVFTDEGFTGKHWSWRFIRWTDIDNG